MDASKRLEQATERRAELDAATQKERDEAARAARRRATHEAVKAMAVRHGVDLKKIQPASDAAFAAKDQEILAEQRARQAEIRLRAVPSTFHGAELSRETPGHTTAKHWLNQYLKGERRPLLITGPPGTGKTYIATAIMRELAQKHHVPVTYTTVAGLLASLRPSIIDTGEFDMQLYMLVPVLVLDDLGAGKLTDWGREQLFRLAHERSHNGRPTITTTNLEPAGIREHLVDERIVQRLFGGADMIQLVGESRRTLPAGF